MTPPVQGKTFDVSQELIVVCVAILAYFAQDANITLAVVSGLIGYLTRKR